MTARLLFTKFVDTYFAGVQADAALALGVGRSSVCRMCSGDRGITPDVALRCEQISKRRFRKEDFIWPRSPQQRG